MYWIKTYGTVYNRARNSIGLEMGAALKLIGDRSSLEKEVSIAKK